MVLVLDINLFQSSEKNSYKQLQALTLALPGYKHQSIQSLEPKQTTWNCRNHYERA